MMASMSRISRIEVGELLLVEAERVAGPSP